MPERALNRFFKGQWDTLAIATVVLLAFSILLGGASRDHALRLALVELAALPLLVIAGGRLIQGGGWRQHRFALGLLVAVAAIPLVQSVPLPPVIWTSLPGRDQMVLALQLADLQPGWSSLSLTPDATWRSFLALLPPAAMFLALLAAPAELRARLVRLCLAAALVSMLLGVAQLASGGERLYPWATTSAGSVNGFFANRNHLATLLLSMIPVAMVIGAGSLRRRGAGNLPLWLAALFIGLTIIALAAIRSRAGILLFVPVTAISLVAAWIAAGRGRPAPAFLVLLGVTGAALTAVAALALPPILARFEPEGATDGRLDRWPIVAEAANAYLPLGSGMGSFDAVYRSVEPLGQLDKTFFNQAHNDYLETWLEAGWLGAALIGAFLVWFCLRAWAAWRSRPSFAGDLQRASTISILAVLLHSIGDYPLRTVAIAVIFAIFCGILESAGQAEQEPEEWPRQRRRVRRARA